MSLLFLSLCIFFVVSVPIAVSLGLSSLLLLEINGMPLSAMAQKVFEGLNSFPLMALPFFILAGNIMMNGGISNRLINFANALVGGIRGGLGVVSILTSMLFATMSGSSSATTAAVGSTLIPAMEKKGYPKNFAAATCASSGELGSIIPPSIPMIIYGLVTNISIGSLFLAGIIPGIFIGLSLILTVVIICKIRDYAPGTSIDRGIWLRNVLTAFKESLLALLMPVIILGGIYAGIFTPTEAAAVAVIYGVIVSLFIYREMKFRDLLPILSKSAFMSSIILLIVAFASIFSHILTIEQLPQHLGRAVTQFTESPMVFLLLANLLMFFAGMFIETTGAILILAPILAPMAVQFGIDPIHFGLIMIVNISIGMVTPPVAVNLYIACEIAQIRIEQIIRPVLVFLTVLLIDLLIITYIPFLF